MSNKQLSKFQQKIVERILRGESKSDIAKKLHVSRQTIYGHLKLPQVAEAIASIQQNTKIAEIERVQVTNVAKIQEIETRKLTHDESVAILREESVLVLRDIISSPNTRTTDKLKAIALLDSKHESARKANENRKDQEKEKMMNIHLRSPIVTDNSGKTVDLSKLTDEEFDQLYLEKLASVDDED
jgi:hypothetical protein